jgi:hypothetical protein
MKRGLASAFPLAMLVGVLVGSPPVAAAQAGNTTVTMNVSGCEGCTIVPMTYRQKADGGRIVYEWTGKPGVVRNGAVRFKVPTAATAGMAFELRAPWEKNAQAQPLIAMSDGVPSPYDASERVDEHCWVGTAARSVTFTVTVRRLTGTDGPWGRYRIPVAWANTASGSKGAIGHQDLPYCTVR